MPAAISLMFVPEEPFVIMAPHSLEFPAPGILRRTRPGATPGGKTPAERAFQQVSVVEIDSPRDLELTAPRAPQAPAGSREGQSPLL
jgi:hypothetical protein